MDVVNGAAEPAVAASEFKVATDFGRVEFPTSTRPPAKWARLQAVTDDRSMGQLVRLMIKAWRLPAPSVIISVTGGADTLQLNDKQKLVFRRGLLQAREGGRTLAPSP